MAEASNRSKLLRIFLRNIGCIGDDGITIELDDIVCLVGRNNVGKSTILRAYELARGTQEFDWKRDRCKWSASGDSASEVVLDVHIPEGIGNVDAKWKMVDKGYLVVRSRWQWSAPDFKKLRSTWNPEENDWAADGKAGGADPVFNSRLPQALRIGSLQDADDAEKLLLTLALTPFIRNLEAVRLNPDSELSKSVEGLVQLVNGLSSTHQEYFNAISDRISAGFQGVFPGLGVKLNVNMAMPPLKLDSLLKEGSGLQISDGGTDTTLHQQGTGARRALFWAMLQVRNELARRSEARDSYRKGLEKELAAEKKKASAKQDAAKISDIVTRLAAHDEGAPLPADADDPSLPGYLLLIDEPENALHPLAARAAQRHLYKLASDPDWQVLLSTHSPYFINPLADHTTIIRLERQSGESKALVAPKTYRSDSIDFDGPTKRWLQALQQLDPSLAEIFFGSYPILVEGDTEHAAFIAAVVETTHPLADRVTIVRARGKATIPPLIRVLTHFKIDFGILHDTDTPFTSEGSKNGMWTVNQSIREEIATARKAGVRVRHRVSVPDFERFLGGDALGKDKPLNAYVRVTDDPAMQARVQALLEQLIEGTQNEPILFEAEDQPYMEALGQSVAKWAAAQGIENDPQHAGPSVT